MKWRQASVGCNWYSGEDFAISTWILGKQSGYMLWHKREQIGTWPTLKATMRAALRISRREVTK